MGLPRGDGHGTARTFPANSFRLSLPRPGGSLAATHAVLAIAKQRSHLPILAHDVNDQPVAENERELDLHGPIVTVFDVDEFLDHRIEPLHQFLVLTTMGLSFGESNLALERLFSVEMRPDVVLEALDDRQQFAVRALRRLELID